MLQVHFDCSLLHICIEHAICTFHITLYLYRNNVTSHINTAATRAEHKLDIYGEWFIPIPEGFTTNYKTQIRSDGIISSCLAACSSNSQENEQCPGQRRPCDLHLIAHPKHANPLSSATGGCSVYHWHCRYFCSNHSNNTPKMRDLWYRGQGQQAYGNVTTCRYLSRSGTTLLCKYSTSFFLPGIQYCLSNNITPIELQQFRVSAHRHFL